MGTVTSANDEWIELHNTGTAPVVLDGWSLKATDGSPEINLTGTISAGGFFLLERTDDTTVPNIPAGVIYSGALSNSGETLTLTTNTESVADLVSMSSGWIAGNSTSKETMQRTQTGTWVTAPATPGLINASGNSSSGNPVDDEEETVNPPTVAVDEPTENNVIKVDPDPTYSSRMILPEIIIEQVPADFSSEVKLDGKYNDLRGRFEWSMGDGSSYSFYKNTPLTHTYQTAGEYVVMLRYYSNVFKLKPDTIHQKTITVIPATITVSENRSNNSIILENKSSDDVDIGNWKLSRGLSVFTFPLYTIIPKGKSITVPQSVHALALNREKVTLTTPNGFTIKPYYSNNPQTTSLIQEVSPDQDSEKLFIESEPTKNIPLAKTNSKALVFMIVFILLLIGALYVMRHLPTTTDKPTTE
jgi:hypothetical protein